VRTCRTEESEEDNEAVARIEAAWVASVPPAQAKEFAKSVAEARARGPQERPPDMAQAQLPSRPGRAASPSHRRRRLAGKRWAGSSAAEQGDF